ncbi:hypothetical protein L6R52_35445, partial [Myxococcota bacterium]|nr:hypothetical protein [Myxococcota bacterium]
AVDALRDGAEAEWQRLTRGLGRVTTTRAEALATLDAGTDAGTTDAHTGDAGATDVDDGGCACTSVATSATTDAGETPFAALALLTALALRGARRARRDQGANFAT